MGQRLFHAARNQPINGWTMYSFIEEGGYPKGSNVDHGVSKELDGMYRMIILFSFAQRGSRKNHRTEEIFHII